MAATRVFLDTDVLINWLAKEVEPGGFSEEGQVTYGPTACSRMRSTSCRSIFPSFSACVPGFVFAPRPPCFQLRPRLGDGHILLPERFHLWMRAKQRKLPD
jgi:hypothetical protein